MNNAAGAMEIIQSDEDLFCHPLHNHRRHLPLFCMILILDILQAGAQYF